MSQEVIPLCEKEVSLSVDFAKSTKTLVISPYIEVSAFADVTFPVYVR
jgi:hypothetical protein